MSLVDIFATAILPIIVVAGVGVVLGRVHDVETGSLNTVTVHVLVPALAFHSIATTDLVGATLARIAVGVTVFAVAMVVVAEGVGRVVGVEEPLLSAVVLTSAFPNAGNFGIPLSEFTFGAVGRSTAVIYVIVQSVLMYTVGIYIAARSGAKNWVAGVRRTLTIPLVYAALAALVGRALGVLPAAGSTAMETLKLVGESSIPLMLLILGIELARTDYSATLRAVGTATVLKLALAPVVAAVLVLALGFTDPTVGRVFVLESATPAAVTPLILLIEFGDPEPVDGVTVSEFASTVVLVTTVVSVVTLTPLVAALQSGLLG